MSKITVQILFGLVFLISGTTSFKAQARVTKYWTTMCGNGVDDKREGNCIDSNRQLIGYDGNPVKKYCPYGIGVQNICLKKCESAAGGSQYAINQTVYLKKPIKCNGKDIYKVKVVDRGSGVDELDIFEGVCKRMQKVYNRKRRAFVSTGVCLDTDNTMMASYDGAPGKGSGGFSGDSAVADNSLTKSPPPMRMAEAVTTPAPAPHRSLIPNSFSSLLRNTAQ